MTTVTEIFGEPISVYTRREAIEDVILVDCTQDYLGRLAQEYGFTYPIAMTATAFEQAVWPILEHGEDEGDRPDIRALNAAGQDREGRWWDVLTMLRCAIRNNRGDGSTVRFKVMVQKLSGRRVTRASALNLKAVCGPNDNGSPCITIMLPDED